MLSIVGLEDRTIQNLCREALDNCPAGTVCQLANYLFPQVRSTSHHNSLTATMGFVCVCSAACLVTTIAPFLHFTWTH